MTPCSSPTRGHPGGAEVGPRRLDVDVAVGGDPEVLSCPSGSGGRSRYNARAEDTAPPTRSNGAQQLPGLGQLAMLTGVHPRQRTTQRRRTWSMACGAALRAVAEGGAPRRASPRHRCTRRAGASAVAALGLSLFRQGAVRAPPAGCSRRWSSPTASTTRAAARAPPDLDRDRCRLRSAAEAKCGGSVPMGLLTPRVARTSCSCLSALERCLVHRMARAADGRRRRPGY